MLRREYLDKLDPDLSKMLESYSDGLASKFKCHRVGIITAFNPERLTVNVRLLDKMIFRDMVQDFAELVDMPLLVYATNDTSFTLGDPTGSECIVHFNDTDIDLWFQTGEAYEPNTARTHNLNDGFVELRPYSLPYVLDYDTTGTVITRGNTKIRLVFDKNSNQGTVEITNGQALMVMSGNTVTITGNVEVQGTIHATGTITSDSDVIASGISGKTHTHGGVTGGSSSTGVPQ